MRHIAGFFFSEGVVGRCFCNTCVTNVLCGRGGADDYEPEDTIIPPAMDDDSIDPLYRILLLRNPPEDLCKDCLKRLKQE